MSGSWIIWGRRILMARLPYPTARTIAERTISIGR